MTIETSASTYNLNARGNVTIELANETQDLLKIDNRGAGTKKIYDFNLNKDTAEFRIDGNYFNGAGDIAYNPYSGNLARVSTARDFLQLIGAVISDDGSNNCVEIENGTLKLVIDADNHWRGDLTIEFHGVIDQIAAEFDLDLAQGYDELIIGTRQADILHRGGGANTIGQEKGDDILIGGGGADTFQFNSTGTYTWNNGGVAPVDRIVDLNFAEGDILRFFDWGIDAFGVGSGNFVNITDASQLQSFGDFLNQGSSNSASVMGNDVYLNVVDARYATRTQTIILHDLGNQVSFAA